MEQYKKLNWSWHKFESEKRQQPRVFNFDTINERDVLSRTINEIHKCVLPKSDKFETFKSPEAIATSSRGSKAETEATDPRKHRSRFIERSYFLIRDYGYSSELSSPEQKAIFNSINLRITHNPSLIIKNGKPANWSTQAAQLTPEVLEKRKLEAEHFNKCAEIYFYRHNVYLNNLVDDDTKSFIINRWKELDADDRESKFQVITMLLRDQNSEGGVDVEYVSDESELFSREAYTISENDFPLLDRLSADDLTFYLDLKSPQNEKRNSDMQQDIAISMNMLATLLDDSEEFTARFRNEGNSLGKVSSTFRIPLPTNPVQISQALEVITKFALSMSLDIDCMNRTTVTEANDVAERQAESVDKFMRRMFTKFVKKSGVNEARSVWKIKNESQSFSMIVDNSNCFSILVDGVLTTANISIKLEYQTKFGAEKMTRGELIKEWCALKFNNQSITLRFRIDAETLKILSITRISLEDVEVELKEAHNTNAGDLMNSLITIFSCLQRIPECDYLMRAKIEDNCKKLYIYKASDSGKEMESEQWQVQTTFTRKFVPIDESTPTFLHVKQFFAPCCFPNVHNKRISSYLIKTRPTLQVKKKPATKRAARTKQATADKRQLPPPKLEQKKTTSQRRKRNRKAKKKNKI